MSETILVDRALCLPALDVEALIRGRIVAAIPKIFIEREWTFAILSVAASANYLPVDRHYHPDFLAATKPVLTQLKPNTITIKAWGKCESCILLHELEEINVLSQLTAWSPLALKDVLQQRQHLFLACLRIYQLSEAIEITAESFDFEKAGKFVSLLSLNLPEYIPAPIAVSTSSPVLSDAVFIQRKQQLENRKLPLHPQLEKLHDSIAELAIANSAAKALEQDIKAFLEWIDQTEINKNNPGLIWIDTITSLGNRSKELDEGKSNYQAGTDFENIVQRSLTFLGFTVDQAYRGGAGGLDLFCSSPYPLVGECKAGKKIRSGTTEELVKLGGMRLGTNRFLTSAKLIIGPGNSTPDVLTAAAEWKVSIINPMSLQKLVELKAKHPGSINLIELKKYLEPGQIDHKIDEYVENVLKEIRLRAYITQILKKHLDQVKEADVDANTLFGVYCGSNPPQVLTRQAFYKILIELSSPLACYLGQNKETDRFYFLRDLIVD
ncbi:MAG: DUF1802 family protein [Stenomitos frigidus ULC029]